MLFFSYFQQISVVKKTKKQQQCVRPSTLISLLKVRLRVSPYIACGTQLQAHWLLQMVIAVLSKHYSNKENCIFVWVLVRFGFIAPGHTFPWF